jgi:integrase
MVGMRRPDFPVLTVSWELALRADGYADNHAVSGRQAAARRPALSADGVDATLERRGAEAGIADLHPHAFRHTWAHAFRAAGGNEGDLMLLGGWRSRAMLDRYGKAAAANRAADAYRRLSLGDRI